MFTGVGEPSEPCCSSCTGSTPCAANSPAPAPRLKALAIAAGLAGLAGTIFWLWPKRRPPRYYHDPRHDDELTREIPREWMQDVVNERR